MDDPISVIAGFILGVITSVFFYSIGIADSNVANWRYLMFLAVFRIKEMTPTSRERIAGGFGIPETENYLTCLSEVISLSGWPDGSKVLASIVADMKNLEHYQNPNPTQNAEREAKKKEWDAHIDKSLKDVGTWKSRLKIIMPPCMREALDSE